MATRQHGGYATQARRRGEQYLFCSECGMRKHQRITRLQMAYIPEPRGCLHIVNATLVSILIALIAFWGIVEVLVRVR